MNHHQENFLEIVHSCKMHLQQAAKKGQYLSASKELQNLLPQEKKKEVVAVVPKSYNPKPVQIEPSKKIEPKEVKKEEIQQAASIPVLPTPYSLQILPHLFVKPAVPTFHELNEKMMKLSSHTQLLETVNDQEAQKKESAWMQKYPKIALVTFHAQGSTLYNFVHNISQAIQTKIALAKLYEAKDLSTSVELVTLIRASALPHLIVAYEERMQSDVDAFLQKFDVALTPSSPTILQKRGKAHTTTVYNLLLSEKLSVDTQAKSQLWNAIKTL